MSSRLFLKRIFLNKIYWFSVIVAVLLLMCSKVYTEPQTGERFMFVSLFYEENVKEAFESGAISLQSIYMGYDNSYLWLFCPIIVGIPCILINRTERFIMFRLGKNKYLLSKYFSSIFASGLIMVVAYMTFASICMAISRENMWDENLVRKLLSVFCLGVLSSLPSLVLSEFVRNKYLILCIPFVLNYFMYMFVVMIIPYDIYTYISPSTYQIVFLYEKNIFIPCSVILMAKIVACAIVKKVVMERRCDCGQQ